MTDVDPLQETDWRGPMVECLRGQMDMLIALSTLVDREMRAAIEERIAEHAKWIVKLAWATPDD